jgi:hypothetical protein
MPNNWQGVITAVEKVGDFLIRMTQTESETERSKIETEMLRYCYFLPKADWASVQSQLDPFIDKIGHELLPTEPLLQRAEELLNRVRMRKAVLQ